MTIAPVLLGLIVAQTTTADPAQQRAAKSWKPGPNITAEIKRLERESVRFYRAFLDGKQRQWVVIREQARRKVAAGALRLWAINTQSDEVPQLVVIVADSELHQVFPRGTGHLPPQLNQGDTYPATADSSRRWQYLGEHREAGIRFAVFRSVPLASNSTR